MRSKMITAALAGACALLAANLVVSLRSPAVPPLSGQSTSDDVVVTSAVQQGGGDAWVFVFDKQNQSLAQYMARRDGLHLTGVRKLTWDFQVNEWPDPRKKSSPSVLEVRDRIVKQSSKSSGSGSQTGTSASTGKPSTGKPSSP